MSRTRQAIRLSRSVRFRGLIFDVTRESVRLSNGRRVVYDVVRHPGSVVLIPQPTPDTVILIRQFRWAVGRWIWELPAGSIDPGERPSRAAARECAEETGWVPAHVERLGVLYPTPGFCDERLTFYRCTGLRRPSRPVEGDEDEQIEPRVFRVKDVARLVARGRIDDMKTVAGLHMVRRR